MGTFTGIVGPFNNNIAPMHIAVCLTADDDVRAPTSARIRCEKGESPLSHRH